MKESISLNKSKTFQKEFNEIFPFEKIKQKGLLHVARLLENIDMEGKARGLSEEEVIELKGCKPYYAGCLVTLHQNNGEGPVIQISYGMAECEEDANLSRFDYVMEYSVDGELIREKIQRYY